MFQRDTMFYSNRFELNYVIELVKEFEKENNIEALIKIRDANYGRFKRYFDFFDFYFENREFVFLSEANDFRGTFNLNHDFIIMSNLCSLIETYYQFLKGLDCSPRGDTVCCYIYVFEMLNRRNPCYTNENARKFYTLIRNGLIHQTNTRINAALSDMDEPILIDGDECFLCNAKSMYEDLKNSIDNYFNYLPTKGFNHDKVINLIKKTKFILNLS